jgi:hypothetical protein
MGSSISTSPSCHPLFGSSCNLNALVALFNQIPPEEQIRIERVCKLFQDIVKFNRLRAYELLQGRVSVVFPNISSMQASVQDGVNDSLRPEERELYQYLVQEGRIDFSRFDALYEKTAEDPQKMWMKWILRCLAVEVYQHNREATTAFISSNHTFSSELFTAVIEALSSQEHITALDFSMNVSGAQTPEDLPILQEYLPKCTFIERLLFSNALHHCPEWGGRIAFLKEALIAMPSLQSLYFYHVELTDEDAMILAEVIRKRGENPVVIPIKELVVSRAGKLTDRGVEELLSAVVKQTTEIAVCLQNQEGTTLGLQEKIKRELENCPKNIKFISS